MLSINNLPFRNLKGYAERTIALVVFSMLMAIALFGGTLLVSSVREGLKKVESRLGADIMVTPADASNSFDAQTVLIQAEPGYFYMDSSKVDEIAGIEGVGKISAQIFMASAKAGCCSARLQMIGFDPETDFTIQPWIKETYTNGEMGLMDVIVGSNVTINDGNIIRFYDVDCNIIGQFEPTGSTLDNCVYMNYDTVKALIEASFMKNLNVYGEYDPNEVVSAIMIKVADGADIETVAAAIRDKIDGVSVATSANMVSQIGESVGRTETIVYVFIAVFWLIGILMIILISVLLLNERKKEFASLAVMGADKGILSRIVVTEAVSVNCIGSIVGIIISAVVMIMFKGIIGESLGLSMVVPGAHVIAFLALLALISAALAAAISSVIGIKKISKIDASLVLKEGE